MHHDMIQIIVPLLLPPSLLPSPFRTGLVQTPLRNIIDYSRSYELSKMPWSLIYQIFRGKNNNNGFSICIEFILIVIIVV